MYGNRRDGNDAFFIPFAFDYNVFFFKKYFVDFKVNEFAHTQATTIKCFNDGTIALPFVGR